MTETPGTISTSGGPRWLVAVGNVFFRFRNAIFPIVFVLLVVLTRPALFLNDPVLDQYVVIVGAVIALLGQAFRMFVIGFAYIKRGGKNKQVFANDLVIAGLYAHTRNPMYVGNFMIACGLGIVYGSPWIYYVVIPFFAFVYLAIVEAEEEYLLKKFGAQYEDYMQRVNRFVPDFRGIGESLGGYRFRWKEVVSKDHGTAFGTLFGLVMILAWKQYWIFGYEARQAEIHTLGLLSIPVFVIYLAIRILKRAGKLRDTVRPDDAAASGQAAVE